MVKLVKKESPAEAEFLPNVLRIADISAHFKAIDVVACDVRGLTVVADCFVFTSVKNEPQLKALFNGLKDGMKEIGLSPLRVEGAVTGSWVVIDYGTIIVHIFREKTREFYDLDSLWGDAPLVDLRLEPEDGR